MPNHVHEGIAVTIIWLVASDTVAANILFVCVCVCECCLTIQNRHRTAISYNYS